MHVELRENLRTARGESHFVIAINVDIRGFSSFFKDSAQAAAYLSKVYTKVLDQYFPAHDFFKPTGDGLLIVRQVGYESAEIESVVRETVVAALQLDEDFQTICADEPLINFPTPDHVGIGVSRGTATRLYATDGRTLDYSGRPLNLASRLMDVSRPRGVAFDADVLSGLPGLLLENFDRSEIYIKGIADLVPLTVSVSKGVVISEASRRPFGSEPFERRLKPSNRSELEKRGPRFLLEIPVAPFNPDQVAIRASWPATNKAGNKNPNQWRQLEFPLSDVTERVGGKWYGVVDFARVAARIEALGAKSTWEIGLDLVYRIHAGAADPPF